MAEIGLNLFQVFQNELLSREGSRSTIGLGFRLAILEEKLLNAEAANRNGKVWKLHHAVSPITALTPEAREKSEASRNALLERRGAKKERDDKDPTMLPRADEQWEVHTSFPRTLMEFKELQFHPEIVRSLLDFYNVRVYKPDFRPLDIHPDDRCRDVATHMETCLEELAMHWGINWQRIDGLNIPSLPTPPSQWSTPTGSHASLQRQPTRRNTPIPSQVAIPFPSSSARQMTNSTHTSPQR